MHESFSPVALRDSAPPPLLSLAGDAAGWAVFLDFDGTLVELAPTPEAIVVPPRLPSLLQALSRHFTGALALVTGRSLSNLDRHLGLSLPAAGQHGVETRLRADRPVAGQPAPALDAVRRRVRALAGERPGLVVEDKGATLAVHYRGAPEAAGEVADRLGALVRASSGELELLEGKSVCEVRPAGIDKGAALEAFLREPPFAGRRPLMLGDDVTDEAGFAVALRAGGTAIKVGGGESLAPWRLPEPQAVRAWLWEALGEKP